MRINLDLIKKVRNEAAVRDEAYKRKATKYYNKRVKNRQFHARDLVLRQIEVVGHIPRKLDPVWKGPFRVAKVAQAGSYWFEELVRKWLLYYWNTGNLKKFYSYSMTCSQ